MSEPRFQGVIPAVPTAFSKGGLDLASMERLYQHLAAGGVSGIVVAGSTGEAATLTEGDYRELLEFSRRTWKLPMLVGVGTNATATTLKNCRIAEEAGADGLLVVTPYYNKPPQQGLYQHFKAIAAQTRLPIILYNVPGRTACNLSAETVEQLAHLENIVGIKEASGNMAQCMEVAARAKKVRKDFALLSGEDLLFLPLLAIGFEGVITVLGNVAPDAMVRLQQAYQKGEQHRARQIHYELRELCEALFVETNPIPVKAALQQLKIFASRETRPPLCDVSESLLKQLQKLVRP